MKVGYMNIYTSRHILIPDHHHVVPNFIQIGIQPYLRDRVKNMYLKILTFAFTYVMKTIYTYITSIKKYNFKNIKFYRAVFQKLDHKHDNKICLCISTIIANKQMFLGMERAIRQPPPINAKQVNGALSTP